ncbi:MAG: carbon-nitrogen hydrolase family protein [Alphaproteobacteria bacterium]|nr:carbon-nitrogen hydrolase family protein [Alphaproteobacteria bacterium]
MSTTLAACVQLQGSSDVERNLQVTERLVRRAAQAGARLIATPEATTYLGPHDRKIKLAEPVDGPTHRRLADLAAELGIWLLVGSVAERAEGDPARCHNTSLLFDPEGRLAASYRKMHLFDVDIPGGVRFQESATCAPGDTPVVVDTPLGVLGLSICYDLRFPELYRTLVDRGAQLLAVPSAFTLMTGKDHWHALLRARAIETQCYVLAPAQFGAHDDAGLRHSYGHSVIIDPWGVVIGQCSDGEGICLAELDPERVAAVRRAMPLAAHRRI